VVTTEGGGVAAGPALELWSMGGNDTEIEGSGSDRETEGSGSRTDGVTEGSGSRIDGVTEGSGSRTDGVTVGSGETETGGVLVSPKCNEFSTHESVCPHAETRITHA